MRVRSRPTPSTSASRSGAEETAGSAGFRRWRASWSVGGRRRRASHATRPRPRLCRAGAGGSPAGGSREALARNRLESSGLVRQRHTLFGSSEAAGSCGGHGGRTGDRVVTGDECQRGRRHAHRLRRVASSPPTALNTSKATALCSHSSMACHAHIRKNALVGEPPLQLGFAEQHLGHGRRVVLERGGERQQHDRLWLERLVLLDLPTESRSGPKRVTTR